jgi:hypothetical protein
MPSNIKSIAVFLLHNLFLCLSILFAFFWNGDPTLSAYSLQFIGLLVLLYFVNYFSNKNRTAAIPKLIDSLIITLVILLVVITTGGLNSPAIFLIFILATFISLLLHPLTAVIIITLISILLERDATLRGISTNTYQFYVWLTIPPIISFISKQYLKLLEDQNKIKILETEEKILKKEVQEIEAEVSTFANQALSDLDRNNLPKLQEDIQSLPDKIDEEIGK